MRHPFYKGVLLGSLVAVVVMMATAALAGSGVGGVFHLGKTNTVNHRTQLTGTTSKTMLQVKNKGSGPALSLSVKAGRPPLTVNSTARVKRLNADRLDGLHGGQLRKVYTARRDITPNATWGSWEEMLTVPGFITFSVWSPEAGRFSYRVDTDPPTTGEGLYYGVPGAEVWGPEPWFDLHAGVLSPATSSSVRRFLVWNSTRAASLEFSWMRLYASDRLTVFVEATVN